LLGERQGLLDPSCGQGDVGSSDGESICEDEPAKPGSDGVPAA
jgi:hypothetical protein